MIVAQLVVAAAVLGQSGSVEAKVEADRLEVFDAAEADGYVVTTLRRGDIVRVKPGEALRHGWLAIEPPSAAFCWVEESALKPAGANDPPNTAKVKTTTTIRSGNLKAKLPGPPRGSLKPGDRVRLVDRPALEVGDKAPKRWRAVTPPPGRSFFVPADGVSWTPPAPSAVEVRAVYATSSEGDPDLRKVDAMLLAETTGQPVEKWRLGPIREAYEALEKADPARSRAVGERLKRLEGLERAAKAAQEFVEAAMKARDLDDEFDKIEGKLADVERTRSRAFDVVGFIQPSAKMLEGRKLFALIGREGSVVAYLDVPPGLDPDGLTAHRVGVRGRPGYNAELKARLVDVRDLVDLETKR
ncbi:hypothetical protein [Paludisphaera rhizosphaerae]|uniref:hypothetical protein n=1 Tax=Paludisphaera rhizosphaerae TaxID=2711216 RepID=UPI0013EA2392|nr:hypothetical protein [Paludisphaera rhizosphaerae]